MFDMGRDHEQRKAPALPPGASPHDPDALRRADVVAFYREIIRRVLCCLGVPPQAWEDLEQDVLATAVACRADYDPERGTVQQWICGITRYAARTRQRTLQRRPDFRPSPGDGLSAIEHLPAPELNPEQQAHAHELLDRIGAGVPASLRETLRLHSERHSLKEIGARFGISVSGVKGRIHRAMIRVDSALAETGEERAQAARVRIGVLPSLLFAHSISATEGPEAAPAAPALPAMPSDRPAVLRLPARSAATGKGAAGMCLFAVSMLAALVAGVPRTPPRAAPCPAAVSMLAAAPDVTPVNATLGTATLAAAPGFTPVNAPLGRSAPAAGGEAGTPPVIAGSGGPPARALPLPRAAPAIARRPASRAEGGAPDSLLQHAWRALQDGRAGEALELARRHAATHPARSAAERAKVTAEALRALGSPPASTSAR